MHRAGEVGGTYIGSRTGAAIEVHIADGRRRNVGPGVVRGIVRVLEGNAIPGDGEVAVLETPEPGLGLPVADAVGAIADRARSCLGDVAEVGHRRGDRKSTRLNSSHLGISYAVFC